MLGAQLCFLWLISSKGNQTRVNSTTWPLCLIGLTGSRPCACSICAVFSLSHWVTTSFVQQFYAMELSETQTHRGEEIRPTCGINHKFPWTREQSSQQSVRLFPAAVTVVESRGVVKNVPCDRKKKYSHILIRGRLWGDFKGIPRISPESARIRILILKTCLNSVR